MTESYIFRVLMVPRASLEKERLKKSEARPENHSRSICANTMRLC